jgi:hypothetical protein
MWQLVLFSICPKTSEQPAASSTLEVRAGGFFHMLLPFANTVIPNKTTVSSTMYQTITNRNWRVPCPTKNTGTQTGADTLTTYITSKHWNPLYHIYYQMKNKQSTAFSNFPCIHTQTQISCVAIHCSNYIHFTQKNYKSQNVFPRFIVTLGKKVQLLKKIKKCNYNMLLHLVWPFP